MKVEWEVLGSTWAENMPLEIDSRVLQEVGYKDQRGGPRVECLRLTSGKVQVKAKSKIYWTVTVRRSF